MKEEKFSHSLRVRYSEIDGQRIVFNAHYMTYVDVVNNEYLREVLGSYYAMLMDIDNGFEIVLVKCEMEFMSPARMDDLLNISCETVKLGNSSLVMVFEFRRDGEETILARAKMTYVSINLKEGKDSPIPPEIRQCFIDYEGLSD